MILIENKYFTDIWYAAYNMQFRIGLSFNFKFRHK